METKFLLCEVKNETLLFVTGLSPRRLGYEHRSIRVGFVVDRVCCNGFPPEYFGSALSVSFHQCSVVSLVLVLSFVTCEISHTEAPFWEMGALTFRRLMSTIVDVPHR